MFKTPRLMATRFVSCFRSDKFMKMMNRNGIRYFHFSSSSLTTNLKSHVFIGDQKVPVFLAKGLESSIDIDRVINYSPFKSWLTNIQNVMNENQEKSLNSNTYHWKELLFEGIEIQSVDIFGSRNIIGFVKFKVNVTVKTDKDEIKKLPGIVFARGGSVGILIVLQCIEDGKEYLLLVQQPRIAIGNLHSLEIPAGSMDDNGNFSGVAAKEVKEETGIEIKDAELIDLTEYCLESKFSGHYMSPGASDEVMRFFLHKTQMTRVQINALKEKMAGSEYENEIILLKVLSIEEAVKTSPDAKLLVALFMYNLYLNKSKI
ncbi:hypothetical protein C9374_007684 [Naegleria lovaniensis]|uniref:Nudix hydrolase domain-containing protein n=1 Tax=Naegleria lovaniensis TaxID=51637 RepID=A0AA88KIA5_NAELO|nr:uncharacterized protein C9374_007684 [Naegleria lovaniensis]KAG2379046.1 hypothetical protein C9374_007684 [Naegleria lovaniensis]